MGWAEVVAVVMGRVGFGGISVRKEGKSVADGDERSLLYPSPPLWLGLGLGWTAGRFPNLGRGLVDPSISLPRTLPSPPSPASFPSRSRRTRIPGKFLSTTLCLFPGRPCFQKTPSARRRAPLPRRSRTRSNPLALSTQARRAPVPTHAKPERRRKPLWASLHVMHLRSPPPSVRASEGF